jgi:hypothetical protein
MNRDETKKADRPFFIENYYLILKSLGILGLRIPASYFNIITNNDVYKNGNKKFTQSSLLMFSFWLWIILRNRKVT